MAQKQKNTKKSELCVGEVTTDTCYHGNSTLSMRAEPEVINMPVETKNTQFRLYLLLCWIEDITRKLCGTLLCLQKDSKVIDSASVLLSRVTPSSRFAQLCNFWISKAEDFSLLSCTEGHRY